MFPLFNKHLDLSKDYFARLAKLGDIVIDATCGNGHDTLFLASHLSSGLLYTCDIQLKALETTKKMLEEKLTPNQLERIRFLHICHSQFPEEIEAQSVKLIVYNLGYLPGGDKSITTQSKTTLKSIKHAISLVMPGGAISITCYPGHPAGEIEEKEILEFVSTLDRNTWNCCLHTQVNREKAPSLLLLQKRLQEP